MTHPGTARDVDINEWLDGIGFKPANTRAKQLGHAAAREYVANLGVVLHELLPAGRDKSLAFELLEDVLLRANRALALGDGPARQDDEYLHELAAQVDASPIGLPRDHRYEAEQRGEERAAVEVVEGVEGVPAPGWKNVVVLGNVVVFDRPGGVLLQTGTSEPIELEDPGHAEALASNLLAARNRAWPA